MKISNQLWIGLIVGAVIVIIMMRSCGNKTETVIPPQTVDTLAIAAKYKTRDSAITKWKIDSTEQLLQEAQYHSELLSAQLRKDGKTIAQLSSVIQALRKDTGRTLYEQYCDSLAIVAPFAAKLYDSIDNAFREERVLHSAIVQGYIEADSITNIAYLSAVDAAVKSAESYNQYRAQNKPRNEVYIGLNGQSNLIWSAGGPEIMFKDKRDRIIKASILFGNTKPIYQVGTAVKINLKSR